MPFFAHIKGRGEGCDYTIGCNQTFKDIKGDTLEEAIATIFEMYGGEMGGREARVAHVTIYDCPDPGFDVDVEGYVKRREDRRAERLKQEAEAKERETYEKLKAKFGSEK